MTIEIRPAAVRAQINEKRLLLNRMTIAASAIRSAVTNFCAAQEFSGDAYTVAQEHIAKYLDYLDVFEACIEKARAADDKILDALGSFGGMSVVSEQEWLDRKRQAEWWAASCWGRSSYYLQDYLEYGYSKAYSNCVDQAQEWEDRAGRAGEMLSKIYSYCGQTNNAHGGDDLSALYDAVRAGSAAFANSCNYNAETHVWGKIDSSWYSDVRTIAYEDYYLRLACGNTQPLAIHNAESDGIRKVFVGAGLLALTIASAVVSAPAAATFGVARSLFFAGGVVTDTTTGVALVGSGAVEICEDEDPKVRKKFVAGVSEGTNIPSDYVEIGIDLSNTAGFGGSGYGVLKTVQGGAKEFVLVSREVEAPADIASGIGFMKRSESETIIVHGAQEGNAVTGSVESAAVDSFTSGYDFVETSESIRDIEKRLHDE